MVRQKDEHMPVEAPVERETKKYVVVKNHIRELSAEERTSQTCDEEASNESNSVKNKKRKRKAENVSPHSQPKEISQNDITELKTVYKKCKTVMRKIETKYGHLLNIDIDSSGMHRIHNISEDSEIKECTCPLNKKILFDEIGQQIIKEVDKTGHICQKHLTNKDTRLNCALSLCYPSIQMEENEYANVELPDNLVELGNILKDKKINHFYRRKVIDKIDSLRQSYLYEFRCERQSLIQKCKENPDVVLGFNFTNLSTLPGYPLKPVEQKKVD